MPVGVGEALPVEVGNGVDGVEEGNVFFVKGSETCGTMKKATASATTINNKAKINLLYRLRTCISNE